MSDPGIVVLAAGGSSRMGRPKQLLAYRGRSLLRHAVETALETGFTPVVVVLGAGHEHCAREVEGLSVVIALNPEWNSGLGSSIQKGIAALESSGAEVGGALLMLHDQPLITGAMLRELARNWAASRLPVAAAAYGDSLGVPAIFARSLFPELTDLPAAEGAKKIILRHRHETVSVPMPEAGIDVDSVEDYRNLADLK